MKHVSFPLLVLLYLVCLAGPVLAQTQAAPVSRNPAYRIGPRDLLEVRVFETEELNVSRRVSEGGEINLPLVGEIAVAGLTEAEAAQKIKGILESQVLQRASVAVQVMEFRSRPISVIGAVRQPGALAFSGRWTLLEALTAAGGLSEGHSTTIHILRTADNGLSDQLSIRSDDLLMRADPRVNIPILPGDLINVAVTVDVTIYCLGEIKEPGAVSFRSSESMTLLAIIARAGGLTERASSKILIKRTADGKTTEIAADYKRILAGKAADVILEPGDIVIVKESFF